ncbi:MAG: hypothetical protein HY699_08385 [Deltaproteobacteria bacterium]|nr:hypothetical protein [Deltaproteobacteria bacterium]
MTRIITIGLLMGCLTVLGGCSYGGVATSGDGSTLYVTRNGGFFGAGRRVFVCKPTGDRVNCVPAPDSP